MKKILYLVTIPDWGGAQKYIYDLALINDSKKFDIIIAAGQSAGFSKINLLEKYISRAKKHQFKYLVRKISPIKDLLAIFEIKKYIDKNRPDYLHLNSSKAGIVGSLACAISKHKPQVWYTVHGWVFNEPMSSWRKKLYIFLERLASKFRDKIIVLGEREKQIAIEHKICSENKIQLKTQKIVKINYLDKYTAKKELNLPQDKKIIGTIANLYPAKGINYLIESASQINNPQIIFAIIGDGPERANYELLISNYKLQNFLLLGEKEDAAKYLPAFDIFILPSVKEGAPFTILEAKKANLPIVATKVGSIAEMLDSYHQKTLIPPKNTSAIISAINQKISF